MVTKDGTELWELRPTVGRKAGNAVRRKRLELAGQTFGKWRVLRAAASSGEKTKWICECRCGVQREVRTGHLVSGASRSCGCIGESQNAAALTVGPDEDAGDPAVFGESIARRTEFATVTARGAWQPCSCQARFAGVNIGLQEGHGETLRGQLDAKLEDET
jgi:hypothetical protein